MNIPSRAEEAAAVGDEATFRAARRFVRNRQATVAEMQSGQLITEKRPERSIVDNERVVLIGVRARRFIDRQREATAERPSIWTGLDELEHHHSGVAEVDWARAEIRVRYRREIRGRALSFCR